MNAICIISQLRTIKSNMAASCQKPKIYVFCKPYWIHAQITSANQLVIYCKPKKTNKFVTGHHSSVRCRHKEMYMSGWPGDIYKVLDMAFYSHNWQVYRMFPVLGQWVGCIQQTLIVCKTFFAWHNLLWIVHLCKHTWPPQIALFPPLPHLIHELVVMQDKITEYSCTAKLMCNPMQADVAKLLSYAKCNPYLICTDILHFRNKNNESVCIWWFHHDVSMPTLHSMFDLQYYTTICFFLGTWFNQTCVQVVITRE